MALLSWTALLDSAQAPLSTPMLRPGSQQSLAQVWMGPHVNVMNGSGKEASLSARVRLLPGLW